MNASLSSIIQINVRVAKLRKLVLLDNDRCHHHDTKYNVKVNVPDRHIFQHRPYLYQQSVVFIATIFLITQVMMPSIGVIPKKMSQYSVFAFSTANLRRQHQNFGLTSSATSTSTFCLVLTRTTSKGYKRNNHNFLSSFATNPTNQCYTRNDGCSLSRNLMRSQSTIKVSSLSTSIDERRRRTMVRMYDTTGNSASKIIDSAAKAKDAKATKKTKKTTMKSSPESSSDSKGLSLKKSTKSTTKKSIAKKKGSAISSTINGFNGEAGGNTSGTDYYVVIVESPSKCSTIEKILNQYVKQNDLPYRYVVTSCMGHIRDLEGGSNFKKGATTARGPKTKKKKELQHDKKTTNVDDVNGFVFPYKIAGIDLSSGVYKPLYQVVPSKKSIINELERLIYEGADASNKKKQKCIGVLLATDPDREGEAMAWHLADVLGLQANSSSSSSLYTGMANGTIADSPKSTSRRGTVGYKRMRFTEITPDAILAAVEQANENNPLQQGTSITTSNTIDYNLVQAQETRRVLDRLAGFTVSPVLFRKISPGLSAGRVQSVGMALVVWRERERLLFQKTQYYNIQAQFVLSTTPKEDGIVGMEAKIQSVNGSAVANSGKDFTSINNELRPESSRKIHIEHEKDAVDLIHTMTDPYVTWTILTVKRTKRTNRPPAPYKTSTLQQDGSRALNNMPVQQVMRIAQQLYEQGLISYMRTDSISLSQAATNAAQQAVTKQFGSHAIGDGIRRGSSSTKKKNTQNEAHEAIRPAIQSTGTFFSPNEISFQSTAAGLLYKMIYQRTMASVMTPLITNQTSVIIEGVHATTNATYQFRTSGSVVVDPGYTVAYRSSIEKGVADRAEGNDDDDDENPSRQTLPPLHEGQVLNVSTMIPTSHETQPPPRYTEASLVQELEALGVGRPSTYARIVQILRDRAYVGSPSTSFSTTNPDSKNAAKGPAISARRAAGGTTTTSGGGGRGPLVPSLSAFVVCSLLEKNCPSYVDPSFTAKMENKLDHIASGYDDDDDTDDSTGSTKKAKRARSNDKSGQRFTSIASNNNRAGPHVQYLNEFYAGENGLAIQIKRMDETVSPDEARRVMLPWLLNSTELSHTLRASTVTDVDNYKTIDNDDIGLFIGPWGPYVKKIHDTSPSTKTVPLPGGMSTDLSSITLPFLHRMLESNGATIGTHPEDGRPIIWKTGRYGSYLQWGEDDMDNTTTHSIPKSLASMKMLNANDEDDAVSEDDTDGSDSNKNLERSLPNAIGITLEQAVGYVSFPRIVTVFNNTTVIAAIGPYGPYLKHGGKSISLGQDYDILSIDAESAIQFLTDSSLSKEGGIVAEVGIKEDYMITVKRGRFGLYLNWKSINFKLPSVYNKNPETIPLDEAWELLQKKVNRSNKSSVSSSKKHKTSGPSENSDSSTNNSIKTLPKRPLSAYMSFCSAKRTQVSQSLKEKGGGRGLAAISKELSRLWSESTPEERKLYEDLAEQNKLEYIQKKHEWEVKNGTSNSKKVKEVKSKKSLPLSRTSDVEKSSNSNARSISSRRKSMISATTNTNDHHIDHRSFDNDDGTSTTANKSKKRLKSAYQLFCDDMRPEVSKEYTTFGEISKELGRLWSQSNERNMYEQRASEEKAR